MLYSEIIFEKDLILESLFIEIENINTEIYEHAANIFTEARVGGEINKITDNFSVNKAGRVGKTIVGAAEGFGKGVTGAVKTTGAMVKTFDNTTDAGGSLIKSIFDLSMSVINLTVKVSKFVINQLVKIPNMLTKLFNNLNSLPENVKSKINGSLELYITINDLYTFDTLKRDLSNYIYLCGQFTQGIEFSDSFLNSDIKYVTKIKNYYKKFSDIKFEKTIIHAKDKSIVNTYLNPESEYFKQLELLNKWFEAQHEPLSEIEVNLRKKFDNASLNNNLSKLKPKNQLKIKDMLTITGSVTKLIGDLGNYVIHDIKNISDNVSKILEKLKK